MVPSKEQTLVVENSSDTIWQWYQPTGTVELPEWFIDSSVDWMDGYLNPPSVKMLSSCILRFWDDQQWVKEGSFYRAYHHDGRMEQLYHNGQLRQQDDGTWHSTRQDGLGGISCKLDMADGRTIILHGPWHASPPKGYEKISYLEKDSPYSVYTAGLFVKWELLYSIITSNPADRAALVKRGSIISLEPVHPDWNAPKGLDRSTMGVVS